MMIFLAIILAYWRTGHFGANFFTFFFFPRYQPLINVGRTNPEDAFATWLNVIVVVCFKQKNDSASFDIGDNKNFIHPVIIFFFS